MMLHGKKALITGGSSGIGLATARLLLEHGARVAVTGTDPDKLARVGADLGHQALTLRTDVTSREDLQHLHRDLAEARSGRSTSCSRMPASRSVRRSRPPTRRCTT